MPKRHTLSLSPELYEKISDYAKDQDTTLVGAVARLFEAEELQQQTIYRLNKELENRNEIPASANEDAVIIAALSRQTGVKIIEHKTFGENRVTFTIEKDVQLAGGGAVPFQAAMNFNQYGRLVSFNLKHGQANT